MRKKGWEREQARALRASGYSLREIAHELAVSLSSASVWARGIPRGGLEAEAAAWARSPVEPPEPPDEPAVQCGLCRQPLPMSAFNRHPRGRQYWCRECYREYFRRRGDLHRRQSAAAKRKRQQRARAFIDEYLASQPCSDCGKADRLILEFDHVGTKRGHVSWLAREGASIESLRAEIRQCEVVCVNCHRRRTAGRAGWTRAAKDWWRRPPPKRYETARNFAYVYSILERSSCLDCGEGDMVVLDFDHVGPKTGGVIELARSGVGLARLEREIGHCEVRCANCHRVRTQARQRPLTRS
jgi:hypothetical protein